MTLGFQRAGFEVVGAFEWWEAAAVCYERNFAHPVWRVDLSDVTGVVPQVGALAPDVVVGGPPCQDFSGAGKRVEDRRAGLTVSFARIVAAVRPRFFVMENVARAQRSHAYAAARAVFKMAGYGLTERVVDASLAGVPQRRKRFFCVGVLGGDEDGLLAGLEEGLRERPMTMRDYFGDSLGLECYYRHPRNYSRRAVFSIDEPSPTVRGVNRPVPEGYPGHPNDACAVDESVRALTVAERAAVQTFPSDFEWVGSRTVVEQLVGNAVPVVLAEYVATVLLRHAVAGAGS
jgi:DNA (cytosine-5)-methyltransferase 1